MKSAHRRLAALCAAGTLLACYSDRSASVPPDAVVVAPQGAPPGGPPPPVPGYGLPDGQWVFTQQYGWIWMPYGDAYTYVPAGGSGEPLEFVFLGDVGWTWVAAPWVWGYGPWPFWGRARPDRFAWYRHGYWRSPRRWHYTAAPERGRGARGGVRPAPAPAPARAAAPAPPPDRSARRPPAPERRGGEGRGRGGRGEQQGGRGEQQGGRGEQQAGEPPAGSGGGRGGR